LFSNEIKHITVITAREMNGMETYFFVKAFKAHLNRKYISVTGLSKSGAFSILVKWKYHLSIKKMLSCNKTSNRELKYRLLLNRMSFGNLMFIGEKATCQEKF
jgi:hypothetical protein